MKKIFSIAFAALAVVACDVTSVNPDVPFVEREKPVPTYEGSGNLMFGEIDKAVKTAHTYTWSAKDNAITINVTVNLDQYVNGDEELGIPGGDWGLGWFPMPLESINEFLGCMVTSDLTESNFQAYNPDGTAVDFSSYKPGMWLGPESVSGYTGGVCFWQWYIWGGKSDKNGNEIYYDFSDDGDYTRYRGFMYLGAMPGASGAASMGGKTVHSHNEITVGGEKFNFDVNFAFTELSQEIVIIWDESEAESNPVGEGYLKAKTDSFDSEEGGELLDWAPVKWNLSEEGLVFEAEYSVSAADGEWAYGYKKFDMSMISEIIGKDINTLTFEDFYPVEADGTPYEKWTVGAPFAGQWVDAEGNSCNWSAGHIYWALQTNEENIFEETHVVGALIFGVNPGNVSETDEETEEVSAIHETVTSKAVICGIPMTISIKIVD